MDKLEPKHVTSYLPYGVKIKYNDSSKIWGITYRNQMNYEDMLYPMSTIEYTIEHQHVDPLNWKLVLRPLSDLTKMNGDRRYVDYASESKMNAEFILRQAEAGTLDQIKQWQHERLLEYHFNVFDLPEELWVDINTLGQ